MTQPHWLREAFQADDAARQDFETFQWQHRRSLPTMSEPQPKEATSMTDAEVRAAIAAALASQPTFSKTQTRAIGRALGMVRKQLREEFAEQLGQLRAEMAVQVGVARGQIAEIKRDVA